MNGLSESVRAQMVFVAKFGAGVSGARSSPINKHATLPREEPAEQIRTGLGQ
jgi:hypothetical protein